MPPSAPTSPERPPALGLRGLILWLVLMAAAGVVLGGGMSWIARLAPVGSPFAPAPGEGGGDVAGGAPGGASVPGVPGIRLASLDGATIGTLDYRGKVVLVDVWATWCGPCRLQAAYLEKLHAEMAGGNVQFLAVDAGEDEATVRSFVEKSPFAYPVLLDPEDSVSRDYGISGLPTIMIFDPQGQLAFRHTGVLDNDTLRQQLSKAGA